MLIKGIFKRYFSFETVNIWILLEFNKIMHVSELPHFLSTGVKKKATNNIKRPMRATGNKRPF